MLYVAPTVETDPLGNPALAIEIVPAVDEDSVHAAHVPVPLAAELGEASATTPATGRVKAAAMDKTRRISMGSE